MSPSNLGSNMAFEVLCGILEELWMEGLRATVYVKLCSDPLIS